MRLHSRPRQTPGTRPCGQRPAPTRPLRGRSQPRRRELRALRQTLETRPQRHFEKLQMLEMRPQLKPYLWPHPPSPQRLR